MDIRRQKRTAAAIGGGIEGLGVEGGGVVRGRGGSDPATYEGGLGAGADLGRTAGTIVKGYGNRIGRGGSFYQRSSVKAGLRWGGADKTRGHRSNIVMGEGGKGNTGTSIAGGIEGLGVKRGGGIGPHRGGDSTSYEIGLGAGSHLGGTA